MKNRLCIMKYYKNKSFSREITQKWKREKFKTAHFLQFLIMWIITFRHETHKFISEKHFSRNYTHLYLHHIRNKLFYTILLQIKMFNGQLKSSVWKYIYITKLSPNQLYAHHDGRLHVPTKTSRFNLDLR